MCSHKNQKFQWNSSYFYGIFLPGDLKSCALVECGCWFLSLATSFSISSDFVPFISTWRLIHSILSWASVIVEYLHATQKHGTLKRQDCELCKLEYAYFFVPAAGFIDVATLRVSSTAVDVTTDFGDDDISRFASLELVASFLTSATESRIGDGPPFLSSLRVLDFSSFAEWISTEVSLDLASVWSNSRISKQKYRH